jgi:hypothetical protein
MLLSAYVEELRSLIDGPLWIDENFNKKLDLITEDSAFVSPIPGYNSVAQILAHLTVWRLSTLSILQGGKRTLTMNSPENWPSNDELKQKGWVQLKKEFFKSQQKLVDLLKAKDDSFLDLPAAGTGDPYGYYIRGLIHHDMYHLGQIGLVIKWTKDKTFKGQPAINSIH